MAKFKVILSDPETGKSQIIELEGSRAVPLVGRKLGETIDGASVGFGGHKLRIMGGSDKDGFPMRSDIHGGVKTRVVITGGVGFNSSGNGARRRKTVRGSIITEDIVQINMKIVEKPKKAEKAKSAIPEKMEEKEAEKMAETAERKPAVESVKTAKQGAKEGKVKSKEDESGG